MRSYIIKTIVLAGLIQGSLCIFPNKTFAQVNDKDSSHLIIVAGSQYATSERHQKRWGEHYRKEWNTPVKVKMVMLDTLKGGLTPYQEGGGRQSKTLRLRDNQGREYVLRSIDKTFGRALPDIAQGTFIEAIANDQVSIGHPYSAITIPSMAAAAGVYHTTPEIIYVPKQSRLGDFNDEYGNMLFLFEQRPDENWETAANLANSKNIISTEKLREKLFETSDNKVDQLTFVRSRLFDFLIGDWGRHEDQWRWAKVENGKQTLYKPIPRDRDQAYTKFDGNMVTILFSMAGFDHLQSFENTIEDISSYNFPARNLDRLMANETTKQQWITIAKDIQQRLTNEVITNAIKQMPEEVFPISGPEIITKIISRRDKLVDYAVEYYLFISKEVDVPASNEREYFEVDRISNDATSVKIYKLKKDGSIEQHPFYSRTFFTTETNEIRLYGMDGDDKYTIKGNVSNSSLLRIIPGKGNDIVSDESSVSHGNKMTRVYDDNRSGISHKGEARIKVTDDKDLTEYQYAHFDYDKKGFLIRPGVTIGIGYYIQTQKWRKEPFGTEHKIMGYYGPNRGAIALEYKYTANQLIGKWNGVGIARLDLPFVANYYGIGNETIMDETVNRRFYRFRAMAMTLGFNLNRLVDSMHLFSFTTNVQSIKIKDDEDRFITKHASGVLPAALEKQYFGSAEAEYQFIKTDHRIVPTRGFRFIVSGAYTQNLKNSERGFATYSSSASFYLPFLKVFSLAVRAGGVAITGQPEFYQLATLSGKDNLRGYRRQRFYGKTSFYNNNELRLILNTRNRLFNGKYGLLAFVDQGRVWQPGEKSDSWHIGYGGGIFVAPFERVLLNASYGLSSEDRVLHLRIGFLF